MSGTGDIASMTAVHGLAGSTVNRTKRRQVSNSMSAQPMTLEPRKSSARSSLHRARRSLRLAVGLIVLAMPLSGCGTGSLWDKFLAKDDTFVEEPADKLYNEGLYLMNQRKEPKAASKK